MQATTPGSGSNSNLLRNSSTGLSKSASKRLRKSKRRGSMLMFYGLLGVLIAFGLAVWFGGALSLSNIGRAVMSSISIDRKLIYSENSSVREIVMDDIAINTLLDNLKSERERGRPLRLKRAAIGYNSNLDMVGGASHTLIPYLRSVIGKKELEALSTAIDHPKIANVHQLAETFAHFFVQGVAAERFIEDSALFADIIAYLLREVDGEYYQFHPGGNAALMGNKLGDLGVKVLLGGAVGSRLKNLLQSNVVPLAKYHIKEELHLKSEQNDEVEEEEELGLYKELQKDEIHLIIEFEKGAKWRLSHDRVLESPRANRFIVSHDTTNSHLLALEPFHTSLVTFDGDLVILAGTHLCEAINHKLDVLTKVQEKVSSYRSQHKKAVHFELASVGDQTFFETMSSHLVPLVDSIGLNEQELYSLYLTARDDKRMAGIGDQLQKIDFGGHTLSLNTALSALKTVLTWEKTVMKGRLSRVHLHSLAFHVICQLNTTADYYSWSAERAISAVAAGSLATTYQACAIDNHRPSAAHLEVHSHVFAPHYISDEVLSLGLETYDIEEYKTSHTFSCFVAPVLICKTPIRTVGLGDTISATGLAYHF
eukprot:TRINITY_DN1626_c0_g3_i1.p1 TRINITY_DN1626_c0_g3~~TRINITY_DN1626_c0_g3_i1.p1  ORF type:complete len:612 (-),score=126.41 TRINITY_DN1626_c0_g3_i1:95-1882(-)